MTPIAMILEAPRKTYKGQRDFYMQELYGLYLQENPCHRKKANIERYKVWLQEKGLKHSYQNALTFKASSKFLKPLTLNTFAIRISVRGIKTWELAEMIGQAKEKRDKGESIGGWLFAK